MTFFKANSGSSTMSSSGAAARAAMYVGTRMPSQNRTVLPPISKPRNSSGSKSVIRPKTVVSPPVTNAVKRKSCVVLSLGNCSRYRLAYGKAILVRRSKRCCTSLNSRNFHSARGENVRAPSSEGFFWYSYEQCKCIMNILFNGLQTVKFEKNCESTKYAARNGAQKMLITAT